MTSTTAKTPKYKDLKFENRATFNKWLEETTAYEIKLEGFQDLSTIYVDELGEILNCDAHSIMYNSKFVDMQRLKVGEPIVVEGKSYRFLVVESIIDKTMKTQRIEFIKWAILAQRSNMLSISIYPVLDFDLLLTEISPDRVLHVRMERILDFSALDDSYFNQSFEKQADILRPHYTAYFKKIAGEIPSDVEFQANSIAEMLNQKVLNEDVKEITLLESGFQSMLNIKGYKKYSDEPVSIDANINIFSPKEPNAISMKFIEIMKEVGESEGCFLRFLNPETVTTKTFR